VSAEDLVSIIENEIISEIKIRTIISVAYTSWHEKLIFKNKKMVKPRSSSVVCSIYDTD
jgi:hypothetical protein